MKKSDKILLTIVVVMTILSFSATYYKTVILGDFEIITDEEVEEEKIIE